MSIRGYRVWAIDSLLFDVCRLLSKEREVTELASLVDFEELVVIVVHGGRY